MPDMTRAALKNTLIVLQLLVLGALLFWIALQSQQDQQTQLSRVLMPEQDAQSIVIERQDGRLEFKRTESGWQMIKPLKQAANGQRVTPLLSLLTLPRSHRYELSDIDANQLGLDPAQAIVQINQIRFEFGHTDASGQKRYLKIANAVYLIDDLIFPLINGATATFTSAEVTN